MELEQYHAIDPRTGWWHQTYRWVTKKENKIINELKDGDRVEVTTKLLDPLYDGFEADIGSTGTVYKSIHSTVFVRIHLHRFCVYSPNRYDLTGCLRKITDTKELTVEQISKELGYDVKVVKG